MYFGRVFIFAAEREVHKLVARESNETFSKLTTSLVNEALIFQA